MDEVGDMLIIFLSLYDIVEEVKIEKILEVLKCKEWERLEKWWKMVRNVKKGVQGEGMEFEFDVKNLKFIERIWKGILDRWCGVVWWFFMLENVKVDDKLFIDDLIIVDFYCL